MCGKYCSSIYTLSKHDMTTKHDMTIRMEECPSFLLPFALFGWLVFVVFR